MSTQPRIARPPRPERGPPKVTIRRRRIDHAEIVRVAAVEAESRAAKRRDMTATAAYFLAQKRGFEPGHELDDWIAAETEIAHAIQMDVAASGVDSP